MNLNSYSAVTEPKTLVLTDQSSAQDSSTSKTAICRAVFDDLMDRDLLGFLLSSAHLRKYLAHLSAYAEPKLAATIKRNIGNVEVIDDFHKHILFMFKGSYIAEAKIKSRAEMLLVLDAKFEEFANGLESVDVRYETSIMDLDAVEMAWKYRHACGLGRVIPGE